MTELSRLVFDEVHAEQLFSELALRLKALDSLESVPSHIRSVIDECLSGAGFEFAYLDDGPTTAAGERLIKVRLTGRLESALATLRAMQGDIGISHLEASCESIRQ